MFPDPQHTPALSAERPGDESVAGLIARQFFPPEDTVVRGTRSVFGAPVPETAIHKHRDPRMFDDEIRTLLEIPNSAFRTPNLNLPPLSRDALRPKHAHQRQLSVSVSKRANAGHHFAAPGFGENVGTA